MVVQMANPDLSLVPIERLTTTREAVPDELRDAMSDTQRHLLKQAEAVERVVAQIAIPLPLIGTQQRLTALLDQALWGRHIADQMLHPLAMGRPVPAGPSLGLAENTAQYAMQLYRAELVAQWPVTMWGDALQAIARCAAAEGAWDLVAHVAEGLAGGPGSADWWHAILFVDGLWGERNYQRVEPMVG